MASCLDAFIGDLPKAKAAKKVDEDDDTNKYTFTQACALNTMMMFGTGPFVTLPYCLASTTPPGPHAMIGYSIAMLACFCDSFIWGELGSRFPLSGGTYVYLRECYGKGSWGDLGAFIFLWQSWISGPAQVASGFIAISSYLTYVHGRDDYWTKALTAFGLNILTIIMLMRRPGETGSVVYVLWGITIASILYCLIAGLANFHGENFHLPAQPFGNDGALSFVVSLGAACRFGIYDLTGYYDVCTMGGEVRNPRRTIPGSCIITCTLLLFVYMLTYVAIIGYLPWDGDDGFVTRMTEGNESTAYIMADFSEKLVGRGFAIFTAIVVCVVIFGSVFSMMAGMMYLPGAAAESGLFIEAFARRSTLGCSEDVPMLSLLALGALSSVFCFLSLETVVGAMTVMLVLVQFMGQAIGLIILRYRISKGELAEDKRVWRIRYLPLVVIPHLLIFSFIFVTTDNYVFSGKTPMLEISLAYILFGALFFLFRQSLVRKWPFAPAEQGANEATSLLKNEALPTSVNARIK